ncbi:MAG TPA: DUF2085 domain-containing protein [Rhodothermales bacterium]|nr:DUF2085 domain-containing protein [Rhodothermales bacterium]
MLPIPDSARPRPTWAFAALLTGLVLLLVALPPFVPTQVRAALYTAFSPVCHQIDARSFHLDGEAFAVCHRCTGIFAGLVVGTLLWPFARMFDGWLTRRAGLLLALSLVPAGLDWLLGVAGHWSNTPLSRTATGAVFGLVAGVYLARGFSLIGASSVAAPARTLDLSHPTHPLG